ncbi:uncharacterized protein KGF55_000864 [Candida pseudojiufengensis]|uniref:uncharacterized protein n=1 Tax=Candida pseudojiufengensis TaxID=497109 RepID=UPI0022251C99|nr:uncharacterized protein KGF55_000864 [Candida pseudojiufengensis]KAI5966555.1 hypothetical protein KGF55_000864 [Candida pseudojiufengensis]
MEIFLKLPKEILSLIFSNIKDKSIIKNLLYIPGLQYIVLERKYPKYEIDNNNNSIETLIDLYQHFEFIPSIIIGNVKQINQLVSESSFKLVNYEVKILKDTTFTDLVSILHQVYIVGVHLDQYLKHCNVKLKKNEIKSFLNFVESTFIQSLTTSHFNVFPIQFPTTLKELTLDKGHEINLNLTDLHQLESFNCKSLREMSSLDDIQLPLSMKNLRLDSCDIETLGDVLKYKNLNLLDISSCPELFDLVYTLFPDSLKTLNFINNFHRRRIDELYEENRFRISYFSQIDWWILIDAAFRFPPNLKNLKICDTTHTLDIGSVEFPKALDCLELNSMGCLELDEVLVNLPKKMSEIIITNCWIPTEGHVYFPESERIKFTKNNIGYDLVDSNLNQLKSLKVLDVSDNYCSGHGCRVGRLDPSELFTHAEGHVWFKSPNLRDLILKGSVPIDFKAFPPPQVSFECENLTKLKMINLNTGLLDLDHFPISLEELSINNLKLLIIQGNFFNLSNLKRLDLENNEITFSMLSSQNFPLNLTHLNLSNNEIEDLGCLVLDNCTNLKDLKLKEVTSEREPEGATRLRNFLFYLDTNVDAILTNYDSEVIFEFVNGAEKDSILKSIYKKRRIR